MSNSFMQENWTTSTAYSDYGDKMIITDSGKLVARVACHDSKGDAITKAIQELPAIMSFINYTVAVTANVRVKPDEAVTENLCKVYLLGDRLLKTVFGSEATAEKAEPTVDVVAMLREQIAENTKLQEDFNNLNSKHEQLKHSYTIKHNEHNSLRTFYVKAKALIDDSNVENKTLRATIADLKQQITHKEESLKFAGEQLKVLVNLNGSQSGRIQELSHEACELSSRALQAEAQIRRDREYIEKLNESCSNSSTAIKAEYEAKIAELEQLIKSKDLEVQELKSIKPVNEELESAKVEIQKKIRFIHHCVLGLSDRLSMNHSNNIISIKQLSNEATSLQLAVEAIK